MKKSNLLIDGVPVSPSLTSILDPENIQTKKSETKKRLLAISFRAFLIAATVSIIAKFLVLLIDLFTNLSFHGNFSLLHGSPTNSTLGLFVILVPAFGGLTVGLIAFYGSKAIRGHGIPEAMEQILTNQSKIKPSITFLKPLSSAISIGTGGPFGAEGPIIATGGALGSTIGQLIKISHYERKILLAAGATAGMSAIFGSPLAAIFLALELLLFEFSVRSLLPVAIACVTGAAGHHLLFGQGAVFPMPTVAMPSNIALATYTVIGIVVGLSSVGVSKAIYFVEEMFEKLPIHWMWWPAIGGFAVGIIGYFFPNTLGVGYDNITNVLSGHLTMTVVLSLCIFKFFSWSIALGSGTSGGTLAPLLTIGGALGALIAIFLLHNFPETEISLPLAALVGMAAMFAGASRALLTSIVFALETTMQSHALLPLLGACLASYLVSYFLMEHNIMTKKIAQRGVKAPQTYEPDILEKFDVREVFEDNAAVVNKNRTIGEVQGWITSDQENKTDYLLLVNSSKQYLGTVYVTDLFNSGRRQDELISSLMRQGNAAIRENETLRTAVELMAEENTEVLMVESETGRNIIGILPYKNILNIYKHRLDEYGKHQRTISLKRKMLKVIINGKKYATFEKRKGK